MVGWLLAALLAAAPWWWLRASPLVEDLAALSGTLVLTEARAARIVALVLARLAAVGLAPALVGAAGVEALWLVRDRARAPAVSTEAR